MSQEIYVVGGGPVGATLALSLPSAQKVTVLEARAKGAFYEDSRALALSHGSRLILEKLGVWDAVAADVIPINTIHISQRGGLGRTVLKAHEHHLPSLGYVVLYGKLCNALDAVMAERDNIYVHYEAQVSAVNPADGHAALTYALSGEVHAVKAGLAVVADGGRSLGEIAGIARRVKEYGHDALIAKVKAELPHGNIAYERFTPQGPMALLPYQASDFSLVWTGEKSYIERLLALDEPAFLDALHTAFGDRVGRFLAVSKPLSFPLRYATLDPSVAPHIAVIGNAAQTMHPVAGQGFNVGLRDAFHLARTIADSREALGSMAMLHTYQQTRQRDTKRGLLFTDFLVNLFSNDLVGVSTLRGLGLSLVDIVKPAQRLLVNRMSFGK